jgi:serine/threonine protein kinase
MTMQQHNGTPAAPAVDSMAGALEQYLAAAEAGTAPPREEFLARYPELAEDLDACLAALRFIGQAAAAPRSVADMAAVPVAEPPLGQLGDFRLVREVGRGGMGVVYEAEQISLGRRVALKVLPFAATLDPRQLQRFHNEARAAAALDHPHIVHVHAVGCERAVHFYAMQYIEGRTLAALIAALRQSGGRPVPVEEQPTTPHRPAEPAAEKTRASVSTERTPRDRAHFRWVAELGIQAAQALDHAHALGIVHRDVKPANLLVDGRGGLWVTDFGLAYIHTDARLTMTGDLVGTLRYMSPEQALARRVVLDHRTDVYSLGATLYELLTLQPAFPGDDRQELLRQIASEDPVPPRRLDRGIPAELEAIVLKAMEKRPQDRYGTAQELADDLERWLRNEPICARRPSLAARLSKWGRRNRTLVSSVAVSLAVLLVLSTVGALVYAEQQRQVAEARQAKVQEEEARRQEADENATQLAAKAEAERQAKEAAQQAREAERLAKEKERHAKETALKRLRQIARGKELLEGIFNALDPTAETKGGPNLQEQLKLRVIKAARQLDGELVGDPLTVADLQNTLGHTLWVLGEPALAIHLFSQARATRQASLGPDDPNTLISMNNLASAYLQAGHLDKAVPLFEQTLVRQREKLGSDHPDTLVTMNNLASAYLQAGHLDKALPLYEQALAKMKDKMSSADPHMLATMSNLATAYLKAGQLDKAVPLFEQTLARCKAKLGSDNSLLLAVMNNLAMAYRAAGQLDKALPLLEQALTKRKDKLGPDHPDTLDSMHKLAALYWTRGQLDRSVSLFEDLLPRILKKLGPDHPETLVAQANLSVTYRDSGRLEKALPLLEEAFQRAQAHSLDTRPQLAWIRPALAEIYEQAGQFAKAEKLYRQVLQQAQQQDKESPQAAALMAVLGLNLLQQKKYADAEPILRQCLAIREKKQPGAWTTFNAQSMLAAALLGQKKYAEAEPLLTKGYHGMKKQEDRIPPQGKMRLVEAAERLVQLHEAAGHKEEAARWRKTLEQERAAVNKAQQSARPPQAKDSKPGAAKR